MLYTKKEIEKLFTGLVTEYISKGAVIDCERCGRYISSEYDSSVDLLAADHARIVVFMKTGENKAYYYFNKGTCTISVKVYHPIKKKNKHEYDYADADVFPVYTFYRYKNIFTDDLDEYNRMKELGDSRNYSPFNPCESVKVKYNPYVIVSILKKHDGFKRAKPENIIDVTKSYGQYRIEIDFSGNYKWLNIG